MIIKFFCYRYWLDLIDGLCSLFYFSLAYVLIIYLYYVVLQVICWCVFLGSLIFRMIPGESWTNRLALLFPRCHYMTSAFIILWFCVINRIFPISRHYKVYRKMTVSLVIFKGNWLRFRFGSFQFYRTVSMWD